MDALIAQATTGFEAEVLANALSPLFRETYPWDSRPVDLFHAMDAGMLTGNAERLLLTEFVERLAHTAPAAFHREEAKEIAPLVPEPKEA